MATKSFYKDMESGSGSVKISRLYKASLRSVDGTSIPPGSTVTNLTVKLWMSRKNGVSSNMHFYYLADYDKCSNKSSSNKYYYIGSCKNHHNNSSTEALKEMRRLSSSNASNYSKTSHNYEVSFSASDLSPLNKAFIAERCIGVTSISSTQIRASSVDPTKYNTDTHSCHAIQLDITYTPPAVTPTNPTVEYPAAANRTTYNTKPWVRFIANANTSKLYWRIDSNGTWQNFTASPGSQHDKQWATALSAGSHTLEYYAQSRTSTNATTQSLTFTVATPEAAVTAGSTMNASTITGLQTNIKNQQSYYGKAQSSFTSCGNGTIALDDHIDQMETAIEGLPHPTTLSSVDAGTSITATTINNIRTALLNA